MNPRLLVPAALLVLLTGCAGESPENGPDVAAAPTTAAAPAPTASPSPTPSPTPTGMVIDVTYAGGEVTGVGARVAVPLGEQVVLRVTSDVADQVHVHGYDRYLDLVPGTPAEVTFAADLPGSYEVELHDAGRPLFQLRVG